MAAKPKRVAERGWGHHGAIRLRDALPALLAIALLAASFPPPPNKTRLVQLVSMFPTAFDPAG